MDKFSEIRKLFPATATGVYMNNAAVAPVPPFISREAVLIWEDYAAHGGANGNQWLKGVEEARADLARLAGGTAEEIFFTKNTSEGLVIAANSLHWRKGDNAVSLRGEFPAVTVPLNLLASRGVELRLVDPLPDNSYRLEDIEAALDSSTRMLMVSFVEFHTGFRNDLAALGALCRERGIFLAVDGVQGVGALRTAVRDWQVDLFSAGGHKWLIGGEGTGFCYLRKESLEELDPWACSWLSVEEPLEFLRRDIGLAPFDRPLRKDARRFEGGTLNIAGIMALGKSVETLLELGPEDIERHIFKLGDLAVEGLERKGYLVISPRKEGQRSGIICFRSRTRDNRQILLDLRQQKFGLGFPCGSIRLSPHYYNNEEDIEALLAALPED